MSYDEALPIYGSAMDVAACVDRAVQRFAKGHKYTLGRRSPSPCRRRGWGAVSAPRGGRFLVQVGRFIEVPWNGWRVGLRRRRVGGGRRRAPPWRAAARLIEHALARGYAVALEEPEACGNVKRRRLAYLFERPAPYENPPEERR